MSAAIRIALANLRYPEDPGASVVLAEQAIAEAAEADARIVCFPECYVPGYPWPGDPPRAFDADFLERAWSRVAAAAARARSTGLAD